MRNVHVKALAQIKQKQPLNQLSLPQRDTYKTRKATKNNITQSGQSPPPHTHNGSN